MFVPPSRDAGGAISRSDDGRVVVGTVLGTAGSPAGKVLIPVRWICP